MIQALNDKVIVKIIKETTTGSGIVLTGGTHETPRGEVVSVGSGHLLESGVRPLTVQVGDVVIIPYEGNTITINGEKFSVFAEQEIIGIIRG